MKQAWRYYFLVGLLMIAVAGIVWRMIELNVLERGFLLRQSNARVLRMVSIPAHRGMITDRFGLPLAISAPVDAVWINPQIFDADSKQRAELASILEIPLSVISQRSNRKSKLEFAYLKRGVPPNVVAQVKQLNIEGVFYKREYKRYYPEGEVTAHVVGFTNIDDKGQEGLELAYNKWLRGVPGKRQVLKDRLGNIVADVRIIRKPIEGHNLQLSIDHRIQYLAYRALQQAVKKNKAKSGSIVVLDVKTGEILAMVNQPSYNPNRRPADRDGRYRNRAVTDVFEPGSTMKAFSIAAALESGKYTPNTVINTNPGWWMVDGHTIQDDARYGKITVSQVVQKSSNVGVAKITLSLPPQNLWDFLVKMGFGQRTRSGFPGEATGSMLKHKIWRPTDLATFSFGYGISVTALQLAHAYEIIADHGIRVPVTFLKSNKPPEGIREIPVKIANEMIGILETVVMRGGTGTRARVPGYMVGGKTGTAYIAGGPTGYYKNRYMASFVGIAPATDPRLVIAVVIRDPKGRSHFGAIVSAPAFAKVMAGALRMMNIAPDNLAGQDILRPGGGQKNANRT